MAFRRFKLFLGIFIPFLGFFVMSQNTYADSLTYNVGTVDFYSNEQHTATVNLPWSVNPGYNSFYLNNVFFNNNDYNNTKLSYISGRVVMEVRPNTTENFFVCGRDASIYWSDSATTGYCLGKMSVVYNDNSRTDVADIPAYFTQPSNGRFNIFFDFNTALEGSKQINFIQYRFYAASGYDVVSRNTPWYNYELMVLVEGRSSISVYETPPSGADISNDLLQQQIGQNQTIINQNNEYYSHEYAAENNISNQSSSDIPNSTDQQTTNLIGIISSFISSISSISATNCDVNLAFPQNMGGNYLVNICQGKEKAPEIVQIGSSILLLVFFVPLAWFLLHMIYNEIRSWTNG